MIKLAIPAAVLALSLLASSLQAAEPVASQDGSATLGAGLAIAPEYAGAAKSRVFAVPLADYHSAGGFFASITRGIGIQGKEGSLDLSAALAYASDRKDKRDALSMGSDALKGMGSISGAAVAKLGAVLDLGGMQLKASAELALSHVARGNAYQFGAGMPLFASAADQLAVGISADYSDGSNAQTFFGVTAAQSAASGYKAFTAKAGFEKFGAALNCHHTIDANWSASSMLGLASLAGDAANSPLTKRKNSLVWLSTLNYKF